MLAWTAHPFYQLRVVWRSDSVKAQHYTLLSVYGSDYCKIERSACGFPPCSEVPAPKEEVVRPAQPESCHVGTDCMAKPRLRLDGRGRGLRRSLAPVRRPRRSRLGLDSGAALLMGLRLLVEPYTSGMPVGMLMPAMSETSHPGADDGAQELPCAAIMTVLPVLMAGTIVASQ